MTKTTRPALAMSDTGIGVWTSPAWRDSAIAWLDEQLGAAGITRTGGIEHEQVRSWAAVLKVPTTAGPVWLKAAGPSTAFEVALYPLLHQVAPDNVLTPIAADPDRGWIVLPDGGEPLGVRVTGPALVDALAVLLPRYGQLQRDLMPHTESMLACGVPDLRPAAIPGCFTRVLDMVQQYVDTAGDAGDRQSYARVAGLHDQVAAWSARLTASPAAPSLDHSDLHAWNMLVPVDGEIERARFFDWGDSVLAHPFTSALVPLRFVQWRLELSPTDPAIIRLRDAYLEVFSDLAPRAELIATLELACHLGKVSRALAWAGVAQNAESGERQEMHKNALAWLEMLHSPSYLGEV